MKANSEQPPVKRPCLVTPMTYYYRPTTSPTQRIRRTDKYCSSLQISPSPRRVPRPGRGYGDRDGPIPNPACLGGRGGAPVISSLWIRRLRREVDIGVETRQRRPLDGERYGQGPAPGLGTPVT
ncbi:hypothetical protein NHX12_029220 [Muraenolepis orangiensis]|uniref:Uncharacterized protein n=1 Tax=Muraenolepis orangiensis TaxID=630683 RepID=A0A9Q0INB6_9TELE|nr:hypothetical protein NHX12_029220 [Muraenolepis orangiensis]